MGVDHVFEKYRDSSIVYRENAEAFHPRARQLKINEIITVIRVVR
jgi:hypothetical protein